MKKKMIIGLLSVSILLGTGTFVFAEAAGEENGRFSFDQMKPHIERIHPDFSEEQQQEMFESCHGPNGVMKNSNEQL